MAAMVATPASTGSQSFRTLGDNNPFRDRPISLVSSEIPTSSVASGPTSISIHTPSRRRGSSLTARFPGDLSHRPLDIIRHEQKVANRSRRRSHVAADTIDRLDMFGADGLSSFHHDGPYDATLLARNLDPQTSPVAATKLGNMEAIRATPQEIIKDSLVHHRPISGTANLASGIPDRFGQVLHYREGTNLNVEMGRKHYDGVNYYMTDVTSDKPKDVERTSSKSHRRVISEGGVEMQDRTPLLTEGPRRSLSRKGMPSSKVESVDATASNPFDTSSLRCEAGESSGLRRAHTTGKRTAAVASALRSKFGSLRRRNPQETNASDLS